MHNSKAIAENDNLFIIKKGCTARYNLDLNDDDNIIIIENILIITLTLLEWGVQYFHLALEFLINSLKLQLYRAYILYC